MQGRRLRFATNAEFLAVDGVPQFVNGVFQLGEHLRETTLGYVFGGIIANAPHVRHNSGALSSDSNHVFEVVFMQVPEPATMMLVLLGAWILPAGRRPRHAAC